MKVYVSAPYSDDDENIVQDNISKADKLGRRLAELGHVPFVPHTMMQGWQDDKKIDRGKAMRLCVEWLMECDAILVVGSSEGVLLEKRLAAQMRIPEFDIDTNDLRPGPFAPLARDDALTIRLKEYEQAGESYRHTYATIWQAGAVLIAVSAAVVAYLAQKDSVRTWMLAAGALPFLVWYVGIFTPMDFYAKRYRDRAKKIEKDLSDRAGEEKYVYLYSDESESLEDKPPWLHCPLRLHVVEAMTIAALLVVAAAVFVLAGDLVGLLPDHIASSSSEATTTPSPVP